MKILIVKLSSLGDVVHAMPAVQDICGTLAQVQIDWVVERGFAPLVRRCAGVNRVIACELRRWRQSPWSAATRQGWWQFKAELQREPYDAVIDLQGLSKSALVSWLARLSPHGQRYALAHRTEGSSFEAPARWVADVALNLPTHSHAVTRCRALCAQALHYPLPEHESYGLLALVDPAQEATNTIAYQGVRQRPLVALVHASSRADKHWPLAHWLELGRRLLASGYRVALPQGNDAEQQQAQAIADGLATGTGNSPADAILWPRQDLSALTDALATCAGVIGVDSGLSHMAVALDLPHVQIYNFDSAWRTGPLNRAHQRSVFAQPCPRVEAVWQAWLVVSNAAAAQGAPSRLPPLPPAALVVKP